MDNDYQTDVRTGDIIAFYGTEWRSRVIRAVTGGPSHVGIVAESEVRDFGYSSSHCENVLFESTTLCDRPCLLTGQRIKGVLVQRPQDRIADYQYRAKVFRLSPHWTLSSSESDELSQHLQRWLGTSYDVRGALWSGTRILKYLPWLPHNDLGSVFCSELIATTLQRLGRMCVWNAGLFSPASLVDHLVKSGVYLPGKDV